MKYLLAAFAMLACMGSAEASWFEPSRPHVVRKARPARAKAPVPAKDAVKKAHERISQTENSLGQHQQTIEMLVARMHALERDNQVLRNDIREDKDFILELKRRIAQGR